MSLDMSDVEIRPASTVLALRPTATDGFEVLMVRRTGASAFMGDAFVFPGGAVDEADRGADAAAAVDAPDGGEREWLAAGLRELAEEAGVFVTDPAPSPQEVSAWAGRHGRDLYRAVAAGGYRFAGDALAYLSNWVTPSGPPRRFDTRFYVAAVPAGTPARPDGVEVTEAEWVSPTEALRRGDAGEWKVPFPTRIHLEELARHDSVGAALDHARSQPEVPRVAPRVVGSRDRFRILLPNDPGYDEAPP